MWIVIFACYYFSRMESPQQSYSNHRKNLDSSCFRTKRFECSNPIVEFKNQMSRTIFGFEEKPEITVVPELTVRSFFLLLASLDWGSIVVTQKYKHGHIDFNHISKFIAMFILRLMAREFCNDLTNPSSHSYNDYFLKIFCRAKKKPTKPINISD